MKRIDSRDNAVFKRLRALNEDARARREMNATVLDGVHLISTALDHGLTPRRVAVTAASAGKSEIASLLQRLAGSPCELLEMGDALLRALSPVDNPSGIVAELDIPAIAEPVGGHGDVLVLAGIQDAGNLGTLLRTAAAAGVKRVWLSPGCAQPWAPKVLRAGMGAHFFLRLEERVELVARLASFSGRVLATALDECAQSLYTLDLRPPTAWIFGAEGQGVPHELIAHADELAFIPMPGGTESLNVAAAAAICLFEQVRQRHAG